MNIGTTIIKSRHSIRAYRETPIDDEVIRDALECARLAPTARNEQPWLFGVVTRKDLLAKIAGLADHGRFIGGAAVCFAVFGRKSAEYHLEDCCAATENLIIALQAHGIGSCWVAGARKGYADKVREILGVPGDYTLVSLVPAGIPADIAIVTKKTSEEVCFREIFGTDQKR